MKSMFSPVVFGSPSSGFVSLRGSVGIARPRMGNFFEDILEDVGLSDVENVTEELDQLLSEVPVGSLRDSYEAQREECLAKSNIYSKYKCLYDLFQQIKRDLRGDGATAPPPPPKPVAPKPEESDFPIVPVAIGGVVLAGVVYAIFA